MYLAYHVIVEIDELGVVQLGSERANVAFPAPESRDFAVKIVSKAGIDMIAPIIEHRPKGVIGRA
ncbi:hypothetical protein VCRA2117O143_520007 [Vibrio crassostreae]|nr:hypothetical protein VCRA2117O143_520007 [Vibrio crassostreae]CAK3027422.1 hypothetical protein VCRA2119O146_500027 [Vibrio crassostreae]CDT72019.1 hypothetical protein VCR20J5_80002 [Vibrio crassostreae]